MMATYIQPGANLDYINDGATTIAYHDVVSLGTRIGIAQESIAVGAKGVVAVEGVYELPAVTDTAFAVGDALYWDPAAGKLTKVTVSTIPAGYAIAAKASADGVARVKLLG